MLLSFLTEKYQILLILYLCQSILLSIQYKLCICNPISYPTHHRPHVGILAPALCTGVSFHVIKPKDNIHPGHLDTGDGGPPGYQCYLHLAIRQFELRHLDIHIFSDSVELYFQLLTWSPVAVVPKTASSTAVIMIEYVFSKKCHSLSEQMGVWPESSLWCVACDTETWVL